MAKIALLALVVVAAAARAQARPVDLTGKPSAILTEPLTDVTGVVQLGNGLILFVDRSEKRMMLADWGRDQMKRVGVTGSGPSEYRTPNDPILTPEGGAMVPDPSNGRAVLLSRDGVITGTGYTRQEMNGRSIGRVNGINPAGQLLLSVDSPVGGHDSLAIVRWDPATRARRRRCRGGRWSL